MEVKPGYKLFGVRVPVELHKRLKLLAVSRGVTMARLVETALQQYVRTNVDVPALRDAQRALWHGKGKRP